MHPHPLQPLVPPASPSFSLDFGLEVAELFLWDCPLLLAEVVEVEGALPLAFADVALGLLSFD